MIQCKTYSIINSVGEVNIEPTTIQLILVVMENNIVFVFHDLYKQKIKWVYVLKHLLCE